jgi:hypothetical protein
MQQPAIRVQDTIREAALEVVVHYAIMDKLDIANAK